MINILGDAKGATEAADATETRFAGLGTKLGKIGATVGAGLAAGGIAAIVGLEKLGSTFDDAMDSIAVKTGATGEELDGLGDSFKSVFTSVPVSADEAAQAIGTVSQQLGLTGKPLEEVSTQLLNLSRITDTDLGTNLKRYAALQPVRRLCRGSDDQARSALHDLAGLRRRSRRPGAADD
jgi:phage-related minor tail protein